MKHSRLRTFLIGLFAGLAYASLSMWILYRAGMGVSIAYIYALPVVLGAIPVLFSSKEGLRTYKDYLLLPWIITLTFFIACYAFNFDGSICLLIILGPFVIIGSLAAFLFRLVKLKTRGKGTPLYSMLFLPFVVLGVESLTTTHTCTGNAVTTRIIHGPRTLLWENIKNVRNIQTGEITPHFIHLMGIPKPLDGRLNKDGMGATRSITWEKGIRFREKIKSWHEGRSFGYDIEVAPSSIPTNSLDEHVMIGGQYFDVLDGGYQIDSLGPDNFLVTLNCRYRVTTSLNGYSNFWAGFVLNQFNETILEVIKNRCEKPASVAKTISAGPDDSFFLPPKLR